MGRKALPRATIGGLARSWRLSLEAANKSARTIEQYLESLRLFERHLAATGTTTDVDRLRREDVEGFLAQILSRSKASTAATRYKCLRLFFAWAVDEEEIERSPMEKMRPPIVPEQEVPVIEPDEIARLLKACAGSSFEDRRDRAVICLLVDTGVRRSELANLELDDVDLDRKWIRVLGKGRRPRAVPFGSASAKAVDRYLRVRGGHARAESDRLWLGSSGRTFTDGALRQMLGRRGAQAGVVHLHAHRFRHTFAHQHLAEGGNEGDLMMLTGWKSRQMLQRYASSTAADRARASYKSPLDRLADTKRT